MYGGLSANHIQTSMTDETFTRFSSFIQAEVGIKMTSVKKTMLQARLYKRLRKLGIKTFDEYYHFVFSNKGITEELPHMVDVITTNKTDFYREPGHFEYLVKFALNSLADLNGAGITRKLNVWSAGCSTGEEPYTLAMVLGEFAGNHSGYEYFILATDISQKVLMEAKLGIYDECEIGPIPVSLRQKYLLKSKNRSDGRVRFIPDLRSKIQFRSLNFMDEDYRLEKKMDIIFCRNVIIYFDKETQEKVLNRLCRCLQSESYLFLGHSETLNGMKVPLSAVAATVYRKNK